MGNMKESFDPTTFAPGTFSYITHAFNPDMDLEACETPNGHNLVAYAVPEAGKLSNAQNMYLRQQMARWFFGRPCRLHREMPALLEELLTASGDILGDHIHTDHRFGDDGTINICHQHTLWQLGAMCKSVGLPQPKPTQSSINKASKELADRIASAECWHQASLKPLPARFTRKAFEACYRDLREVSDPFYFCFLPIHKLSVEKMDGGYKVVVCLHGAYLAHSVSIPWKEARKPELADVRHMIDSDPSNCQELERILPCNHRECGQL
jgi:hypothetical protein